MSWSFFSRVSYVFSHQNAVAEGLANHVARLSDGVGHAYSWLEDFGHGHGLVVGLLHRSVRAAGATLHRVRLLHAHEERKLQKDVAIPCASLQSAADGAFIIVALREGALVLAGGVGGALGARFAVDGVDRAVGGQFERQLAV